MNYRELSIWSFLEKVASTRAAPAGGSIAAVSGALAAALLAKMGRLALRRRATQVRSALSIVEGPRDSGQAPQRAGSILSHDLVVEAEALRRRLMALAHADGQAYEAAARLSRSEKASAEEVETAWQETVSVPLRIADACERLLELAETLRLAGLAAADVRAVIVLASACSEVQWLNAWVNLTRVSDTDFRQAANQRLESLRERLNALHGSFKDGSPSNEERSL
jgi:formiminotetrahydrofolate cyclodeaminase